MRNLVVVTLELKMPRPSPVTDAVRRLVLTEQRHLWSLDELHARVREQVATANFSTILRAVGTLEQSGVIDRIELGDGKARYEPHQEHHEHVQCTGCGRVAEVPGCILEETPAMVEAGTGFRISGHQLVFTGLCPACSSRAGVA
jgi:Fe2+ or Zn2+ uptake regulation protein